MGKQPGRCQCRQERATRDAAVSAAVLLLGMRLWEQLGVEMSAGRCSIQIHHWEMWDVSMMGV